MFGSAFAPFRVARVAVALSVLAGGWLTGTRLYCVEAEGQTAIETRADFCCLVPLEARDGVKPSEVPDANPGTSVSDPDACGPCLDFSLIDEPLLRPPRTVDPPLERVCSVHGTASHAVASLPHSLAADTASGFTELPPIHAIVALRC